MNSEIERDLGEQPLAKLMDECKVKPRDLVESSVEQITYKMVSRACKGRRLTLNVKCKILNALMKATKNQFSMEELFTY